jgi:hypothetical protein
MGEIQVSPSATPAGEKITIQYNKERWFLKALAFKVNCNIFVEFSKKSTRLEHIESTVHWKFTFEIDIKRARINLLLDCNTQLGSKFATIRLSDDKEGGVLQRFVRTKKLPQESDQIYRGLFVVPCQEGRIFHITETWSARPDVNTIRWETTPTPRTPRIQQWKLSNIRNL